MTATDATDTATTHAHLDEALPHVATDLDEFVERISAAVLATQEVQAMYLGDRLGWYRALADRGPLTSVELAEATDSDERYAREWLEHQAAAAYVTVDDVRAGPRERRYTLPPAHATVLTDEDSLAYLAPLARAVAGFGRSLGALVEAYRTGGAVSWDDLGDDGREGQAAANRPLYLHALGQELLPQAPEVHARLQQATRIADVGCGFGWSTIGLARAYPAASAHGIALDEASIRQARDIASREGLAERVTFTTADAGQVADHAGAYDAVFAFDCIHDMGDPVAALATMRTLVRDDGVVVVMDERTEEHFQAPASPLERMLYGFSLVCCLPDGRSHDPSVATGTVMRPATLRAYAQEAGFQDAQPLPIDHESFRFYQLTF
jgi:2-polyprenyl-3-methyl-5-hydroxy-6-metoxy-1,4-benzoquinol methylase